MNSVGERMPKKNKQPPATRWKKILIGNAATSRSETNEYIEKYALNEEVA